MTLMYDNNPHCDHPQLSCLRPSQNWFVSLFLPVASIALELYIINVVLNSVTPTLMGETFIHFILSVKDQCLVLFPYTAQNEDELSLLEGQVRLVCSCHLRLLWLFIVADNCHHKRL